MKWTIGQYAVCHSQCRFCNYSLNFGRYILHISCKNKQKVLSYGYSKLKLSPLPFLQLFLLYEFACKLPIQHLESAWQKPLFVRNVCFFFGFILHTNKTYPARFIYLAGFHTLYTEINSIIRNQSNKKQFNNLINKIINKNSIKITIFLKLIIYKK